MSKKKKGKKGRKEAFDPEKDTGILRPVRNMSASCISFFSL